jgi:hypothetical protein
MDLIIPPDPEETVEIDEICMTGSSLVGVYNCDSLLAFPSRDH